MLVLKAHLTFGGQAEEALNFYSTIFNGKIEGLLRFSDVKNNPQIETLSEKDKQRIINSKLRFGNNVFSICDTFPNENPTIGNIITLDISSDNEQEIIHAYTSLSEGGKIIMPLETTFFSPNFGILVDKFGIRWNIMQMMK